MIKVLLFDFSRVLLFPKDQSYSGRLNDLYKQISSSGDYKFFNHYSLNDELLKYLEGLKNKYILAIYTTEVIQNDPAIKSILNKRFSQVFSVKELGFTKKDSESYLIISKVLEVKPEEILFIDDTLSNIEIASDIGLQTIHFIDNKQLFKDLKNKL